MTLERELIEIFAAASPYPRNREILVGYYGWEDGEQHTLTEIGVRFGITRPSAGAADLREKLIEAGEGGRRHRRRRWTVRWL